MRLIRNVIHGDILGRWIINWTPLNLIKNTVFCAHTFDSFTAASLHATGCMISQPSFSRIMLAMKRSSEFLPSRWPPIEARALVGCC